MSQMKQQDHISEQSSADVLEHSSVSEMLILNHKLPGVIISLFHMDFNSCLSH